MKFCGPYYEVLKLLNMAHFVAAAFKSIIPIRAVFALKYLDNFIHNLGETKITLDHSVYIVLYVLKYY